MKTKLLEADPRLLPLLHKFLRFLTGGGAVWLTGLLVTAFLTEWAGLDAVWAYRLVLLLSFFVYFYLNLKFIFLVRDQLVWRMAKYAVVSFSLLSVDGLLMEYLYRTWGWHYGLALTTSRSTLLVLKFFIFHFLVFQEKPSGVEKKEG